MHFFFNQEGKVFKIRQSYHCLPLKVEEAVMDQFFGSMFNTLSNQTAAMQQSFNQMNIQNDYDWDYNHQDEVAIDTSVGSRSVTPKFDQYDKIKEKWENYLQRFNQHLTIYDILTEEKKRACLLSWVGPETYSLLRSLVGSTDINTQTFEALSEKLTEHFKSSASVQQPRY